ncbi:MAG: hypothetical protein HFI48_01305 [Lachnospiraceae bacterium]|nr:hypothetical protein [Lachnospiraceae bacterium]
MKYANEGMDCKKYALLLLQKLWIPVLAAFIGAVLGGGIYLFVHVVINSNRQYQAQSKLYLDFAADETGEVYQAYNGYTWNDLMATEPLLNLTMSYLPEGYTEEEVIAATTAEILSDLRLLTITIKTTDAARTAEILGATDRALVDFGQQEKEFISIEIYRETEPQVEAAGQRLLQAVMLGAFLAFAAALLGMALLYVLNDNIYVPGDLKYVTKLPFAGYCFSGREKTGGDGIVRPDEEKRAAGADTVQEMAPKRPERSKHKQSLREKLQQDTERNLAYLAKETGTLMQLELQSMQDGAPKSELKEEQDDVRKADGILLVVPYGKMDRATLNYKIEQLTLQGCRIAGILIRDADMRFMRWYYNHL